MDLIHNSWGGDFKKENTFINLKRHIMKGYIYTKYTIVILESIVFKDNKILWIVGYAVKYNKKHIVLLPRC